MATFVSVRTALGETDNFNFDLNLRLCENGACSAPNEEALRYFDSYTIVFVIPIVASVLLDLS